MNGRLRRMGRLWVAAWLAFGAPWPCGGAQADEAQGRMLGLFVGHDRVTPSFLATWKARGATAVVVPLDAAALKRWGVIAETVERAGLELWPWVEVGRDPALADAHPDWMAAPGGHHDDWRRRFPRAPKAQAGEVLKAWPWVPVGYAPAFEAHRERLRGLLGNLPGPWAGVFLNDLQAGPSSCGCGNDQCRWALDYGSGSTAPRTPGDDAAARIVAEVLARHPGKRVVPVWVTECEMVDLPGAAGGTGLCGGVPCARNDCWPRYARNWNPLVRATEGPIALGLWPATFGRDPERWIETALGLFLTPPGGGVPLPPARAIAVVQAWGQPPEAVDRLLDRARRSASGWVLMLDPIDESWEPRAVPLARLGGDRRPLGAAGRGIPRAIGLYLAGLTSALPLGDEPKAVFLPERFETLINPACSHCVDESRRQAGALRSDDRVLAWIRGKYEGGAIPYRWFLVPYRVISDTYGVFVYDADADFVRGWPASLDYRFHGWRNGVMVMRHQDGTLFDCLTGEAFDGPRKGERLTPLPTVETDWGPWLAANPGTVAYAMVARFQPHSLPNALLPESRQTRPAPDPRLDPEERVFGLALDGASRAWPLKGFGSRPELREATLGVQKTLILWDGRTRTAAAYAPEVEGQTAAPLTLRVDASGDPEAPWVDRETGSRWSLAGRAVAGPRKGQTLRWLPGLMVKWYAWAAEYPQTTLETSGAPAARGPSAP